jgi:hypothetical protein
MKRKGAYSTLQAVVEAGGPEADEAIADHGTLQHALDSTCVLACECVYPLVRFAVNEALMKKIIQESSALTLEAGLGAAVAIVSCKAGAHKARFPLILLHSPYFLLRHRFL